MTTTQKKQKTEPKKVEPRPSEEKEFTKLAREVERFNPDFINWLRSKNLVPKAR